MTPELQAEHDRIMENLGYSINLWNAYQREQTNWLIRKARRRIKQRCAQVQRRAVEQIRAQCNEMFTRGLI